MIEEFWNWLYSSVNAALSTFNTIYNNSMFTPFFNIFLVVIGIGVIMKFIIRPMLGNSGSDKVKEEKDE